MKKQYIVRQSAGIITLNRAHNKILVVYPTNQFGDVLLTIPKGLIEEGENTLQAARREWGEEVGLSPGCLNMLNNECALLMFITKYYSNELKQKIRSISIYFIADLNAPDGIINNAKPIINKELGYPEIEKVEWLDIYKLHEMQPSRRNMEITKKIHEFLLLDDELLRKDIYICTKDTNN